MPGQPFALGVTLYVTVSLFEQVDEIVSAILEPLPIPDGGVRHIALTVRVHVNDVPDTHELREILVV